MSEFNKAGEVVQHGIFGAPPGCNWLYLQYGVRRPVSYSSASSVMLEWAEARMHAIFSGKGEFARQLQRNTRCSINAAAAAQDKWAAQRAMYRDGEHLARNLMIGVRPLDAGHMCAPPPPPPPRAARPPRHLATPMRSQKASRSNAALVNLARCGAKPPSPCSSHCLHSPILI